MAYAALEPWWTGPALITSTLANIHRDTKKRPEPFTVGDFLPTIEPDEAQEPEMEEQPDPDLLAAERRTLAVSLKAALGHRVTRKSA